MSHSSASRCFAGWLLAGFLFWGFAVTGIATTFSGCVTRPDGTKTVSPIVAQLAIQYATLKTIERHPEYAPRIVEIARGVGQTAGGDATATVAAIETAVRAQIRWERLSPADTTAVNALLLLAVQELNARIGSGLLKPEQRVVVAQVAGWIEEAARSTLPPAP